MTSILESSLSPTQGKTSKAKYDTCATEIMDDDEKLFKVSIDYSFFDYVGFEPEIVVTDFDYAVDGSPNISDKELCFWVKEAIRENAGCIVNYQ